MIFSLKSSKYYTELIKNMTAPVSIEENGIKLKPELMEKEKLYHCIYNDKVLLFYKDEQEILNCYEIEEKEIVDKVKSFNKNDDVEKFFENYVKEKNLKK